MNDSNWTEQLETDFPLSSFSVGFSRKEIL